jgi:solute carrier family 25 iron transporter 28/37
MKNTIDAKTILIFDEDYEDWDPSKGSFILHAFAGSMAGLAEHTSVYPVDTIKTHMQAKNSRYHSNSNWITVAKDIVAKDGIRRMWRGVSTMLSACIPAHALYFSILEYTKESFGANKKGHTPIAAAASGICATVAHDSMMTPADICKQRMQLGHYSSVSDAFRTIIKNEGASVLWMSFPTTLMMNIPYGCVMVATNETLKEVLNPSGEYNFFAFILAGAFGGGIAAAVTCPLDVIKTQLQTMNIVDKHLNTPAGSNKGQNIFNSTNTTNQSLLSKNIHGVRTQAAFYASSSTLTSSKSNGGFTYPFEYVFSKPFQVANVIYKNEGIAGFFKGVRPRMMLHMPSVALSWSTYETVKYMISNVQ